MREIDRQTDRRRHKQTYIRDSTSFYDDLWIACKKYVCPKCSDLTLNWYKIPIILIVSILAKDDICGLILYVYAPSEWANGCLSCFSPRKEPCYVCKQNHNSEAWPHWVFMLVVYTGKSNATLHNKLPLLCVQILLYVLQQCYIGVGSFYGLILFRSSVSMRPFVRVRVRSHVRFVGNTHGFLHFYW